MTRELARQFNEEVEQYRRSLLYFARTCEWDQFKSRAGALFEYLENIEASELEKRFYAVFYCVLGALLLGVFLLLGIEPVAHADWVEHRTSLLMATLSGCSFELFFYINFRRYVEVRMAGFMRRREAFIRGIERDFRSFAVQAGGSGA